MCVSARSEFLGQRTLQNRKVRRLDILSGKLMSYTIFKLLRRGIFLPYRQNTELLEAALDPMPDHIQTLLKNCLKLDRKIQWR